MEENQEASRRYWSFVASKHGQAFWTPGKSRSHTVLFPLDTSIPILSMGIPSFLIKYCNASAPAYYDSIWFVTRTRHSRSNLLNRIFITRGRRTVYSSSAWLTKETVHPLPSHYNKNKHSLRGFISASGAMLILYQTKSTPTAFVPSLYHKSEDCKSRPILLRFLHNPWIVGKRLIIHRLARSKQRWDNWDRGIKRSIGTKSLKEVSGMPDEFQTLKKRR